MRILLTAAEAYPALEREFLAARREIWASFFVFDLETRLRSPEALAIGRTWFDLVVHTLNRGVALNFVLGDADPIGSARVHRDQTRHLHRFDAAREAASEREGLQVRNMLHPAQSGLAVRLALWPYLLRKLIGTSRWLNGMTPELRAESWRDMPQAGASLRRRKDGTIRPRLFRLPHFSPARHHQKLAVFDRRLLYIGGLDLQDRCNEMAEAGRSVDRSWHDVQLIMSGRVVQEAQQHLETFVGVTDGAGEAPPMRNLLRTLSCKRNLNLINFGPKPVVSELRQAHVTLLRRAKHLIYLETQYFRDRALAAALAEQAAETPELGLILILPAAPDEAAFRRRRLIPRLGDAMQDSALRILRRGFGSRLFVGSPAQRRAANGADADADAEAGGKPLIHVHAKVSIFDDNGAIVSSANLDGRGLFWDTEAGVYLYARHDTIELRHRIMAHWLPKEAPVEAFAIETAVPTWAGIARANARLPQQDRQGVLLPYDVAHAETFGRSLPAIPADA